MLPEDHLVATHLVKLTYARFLREAVRSIERPGPCELRSTERLDEQDAMAILP